MVSAEAQRDKRRAQAIKYVGALDGIRALAALGVVIIHTESEAGVSMATYVITGAFAGPLFMSFFAITGFVLYRGWARRHLAIHDPKPELVPGATGSADGGSDGKKSQFLLRRLIRIYPLYWLVATAAMFVAEGESFSVTERIQVYLLSPWPDPDNLIRMGLGLVVWTLVIDIAFYVFVTVHGSVMSLIIKRVTRYSPFVVEHLAIVPMFVLPIVISPFVSIPLTAICSLPLGMWGAVVEAQQDRLGRPLKATVLIVGQWRVWLTIAVILGPVVVWDIIDRSETYDELIADTWAVVLLLVLASGAILGSVLWGKRTWPLNRLLASRGLQKFGLLTYGLYLWHPVVLKLLDKHLPNGNVITYEILTVSGSLAIAFVTYSLVEKPLSGVRTRLRSSTETETAPAS